MQKRKARKEMVNSEAYLGKVLECIRKMKNVTQDDLCVRSGVSRSSISAYERGERNPKASSLRRLADALNIDFELLLENTAVQWHATGGLKEFTPATGKVKTVNPGGVIPLPPVEQTAGLIIDKTDLIRKTGPFRDEWEKRLIEHYRNLSGENQGKAYDFILSLRG